MICRILSIVVILIIFLIIGIISLKIFNDSKTEKQEINTIEHFDLIQNLNDTIISNNSKINDLLRNLNSVQPSFTLQNIDTNGIYNSFGDNVTSNINILTSNVSSYYSSSANRVSNTINELDNTVSDLENIVNNLNNDNVKHKTYSKIKSLNNGQELTLFNTENTLLQDSTSGYKIPGYLVGLNNGCLSVGANDYDVYKCDDRNKNQYFKMQHIMNKDMYLNAIDTALPIDNTNFNKINYPFVMLKSVNNENCLTNNHGSLTVQPCYTFESQRWFAM